MESTTIKKEWAIPDLFPDADAEKVAAELESICDDIKGVKPKEIVEMARDSSTELHKCFEWNDTVAAEKYRLVQAKRIAQNLVYRIVEIERPKIPPVRFLYKTKPREGYKPITFIMQKPDEYKALLERAYRELSAFKAKYSKLQELKPIFDLIP